MRNAMRDAIVHSVRRLESGERWWLAEFAIRLIGIGWLALAGLAGAALRRAVAMPPVHDATGGEFLLGVAAFVALIAGLACCLAGPMLFHSVPVPRRRLV